MSDSEVSQFCLIELSSNTICSLSILSNMSKSFLSINRDWFWNSAVSEIILRALLWIDVLASLLSSVKDGKSHKGPVFPFSETVSIWIVFVLISFPWSSISGELGRSFLYTVLGLPTSSSDPITDALKLYIFLIKELIITSYNYRKSYACVLYTYIYVFKQYFDVDRSVMWNVFKA